jgi:phage repressor protein C with HTH and peptisase S24 domain
MALDSDRLGEMVRQRRDQLGWSQERLAQASGASQSTVDRIEKGQFKRIPEHLLRIASAMGLELAGLSAAQAFAEPLSARPTPEPKSEPRSGPDTRSSGDVAFGRRDLPVFAAAEGGSGEMVVSTDPIEMVPRPWYLKDVRDGYAVLIVGDSMAPAFEPGDIAVVNPRLPPMRGKDMIFISDQTAGEFTATIKRLIRWTERDWHVRQFNPPSGQKAEFTLSRKTWPRALRVVGKYYGG